MKKTTSRKFKILAVVSYFLAFLLAFCQIVFFFDIVAGTIFCFFSTVVFFSMSIVFEDEFEP